MSWRPLEGIRVLDLSRLLPGPFLSQMLADLGADVVKVEEPGIGDFARVIPPEVDGVGFAFAAVNRGKHSVAIDLRAPGARDVVLRLAARADVLLDSFRPGVLDRVGLTDAAFEGANPRLVRVALVGYPDGAHRDQPGHDLNYVALAGVLSIQGTRESPVATPVTVADIGGSLYGATAVLAALHERARTGKGRRVEVSLLDAALAFNSVNLQRVRAGEPPPRGAWELAGGIPGYRVYRCGDGGFVALGALEPKFWDRFVQATGRGDLADAHLDPGRFWELETLFSSKPRDEWVALLMAKGVPATPVLDLRETLDRFGERVGPTGPLTGRASEGDVPALGAHTDDVLREAGFSPDEIAKLRADGVVG